MNKIDEFLLNFQAKRTKQVYKSHLTEFFRSINSDPNTYFSRNKTNKDYENDVRTFWLGLNGKAPLTIRNTVSVLKIFLIHNDIELKIKFWKDISKRTKGNRAIMIDTVPTNIQLKQILTHADTLGRSLFLILSSSGMRIGEACQITLNDIDLQSSPAKITIQGDYTKTGNSRIVFISNESKTALNEWLKIRQEYLNDLAKHVKERFTHYEISTDDNRVFPFNTAVSRVRWNDLIKKTGFNEKDLKTGRYKMHVHTLRKYFRTRMALDIPVDVVEALMGHEGYLTQAYRRYSIEQLGDLYQKGVHNVLVFESLADLSGIHEELKEVTKENIRMKQEIHNMRNQIGDFQNLIDDPNFRVQMMNMMAQEWEKLQQGKLKK